MLLTTVLPIIGPLCTDNSTLSSSTSSLYAFILSLWCCHIAKHTIASAASMIADLMLLSTCRQQSAPVSLLCFCCLLTMHMQVSPSGLFVATFFMKTVFIYSTKRPALPPLKLYHTREITVSPLLPHVTCNSKACLLQPDAYDTSPIILSRQWDSNVPVTASVMTGSQG